MSELSDVASTMFTDAFGIVNDATALIDNVQCAGSLDLLDEEVELELGGKILKVRGTLIVPRAPLDAAQVEPQSQRRITITKLGQQRTLRIAHVESDELAFTIYLQGLNQ